jgi:hypothetical protein
LKDLIKNILTTILAITLLIGTNGLQVYKHICLSHNFAGVSLLETPQCEKNHSAVIETDDCCKIEEVVEYSCCESENSAENYPVNYTSQYEDCCVSIVDSKKIDESIYPPIDKKNISIELSVIILIDTKEIINQSSVFTTSTLNHLPPLKFGRELLQTIHQLKIDTPVC